MLALQLWRRIGNHTYQYSDVQWKDSPVYFIPHRWDTVITHLEQCSSRMVLYMNVSARGGWLEPEVLWIRRDQAAAPVNLVKVQCNTSWISLFCRHTSSYFWSVKCIALKFRCTFIASCTDDDKDRTITVFSLKIQADPRFIPITQIATRTCKF